MIKLFPEKIFKRWRSVELEFYTYTLSLSIEKFDGVLKKKNYSILSFPSKEKVILEKYETYMINCSVFSDNKLAFNPYLEKVYSLNSAHNNYTYKIAPKNIRPVISRM